MRGMPHSHPAPSAGARAACYDRRMPSVRDQFAEVARQPDDEIDLAVASLLIAAEEYDGLDVATYNRRVDDLAEGAKARVGGARLEYNPRHLIDRFHTYLFEEL